MSSRTRKEWEKKRSRGGREEGRGVGPMVVPEEWKERRCVAFEWAPKRDLGGNWVGTWSEEEAILEEKQEVEEKEVSKKKKQEEVNLEEEKTMVWCDNFKVAYT
ncbi:unnamed protein product [Zymoseptoria tritici ST99CH_1A5]|uniref:Uncharacterized protein n=1 Tax=Zymoseptoria tritici ST99CH_1A5 TaxID=1276529 RepID=A0A1Y6M1P7_ZYMTR|nr:unnamed protein product [Zymoseptoria tritici ST99CH_1A5]